MYSRRKTGSRAAKRANKLGRHNVTSPLKLERNANDHENTTVVEYPHILHGQHRDFVFLKPPQHRVTTPCNYALETKVKPRWRAKGGREEGNEKRKKERKGKNSCREMGIRCGREERATEEAARSCKLFPDFKFTATLTVYIRNTCIRADGYSCLTPRVQRRINGDVRACILPVPRRKSLKDR